MSEWWMWFTRMENAKPLALVLFFSVFCGILIYVFMGKARSQRLESYKYIPFLDDESHPSLPLSVSDDPKKTADGKQS